MTDLSEIEAIASDLPDQPGASSLLVFKTADLGLDRDEWIRLIIAGAHNVGLGVDESEIEGLVAQYYDGRIERRGPWEKAVKFLRQQMGAKVRPVPLTFQIISRGTKSLMPGAVTVIYGLPGAGKSLWMLQNMLQWHTLRVPFAWVALEDSTEHHINRALAMKLGRPVLADPDWVCENAVEAEFLISEHEDWGRRFGASVYCPSGLVSYKELLDMIDCRVSAGARVVVVDPISYADTDGASQWDADKFFLNRVRPIIRDRASLFVVHHPADAKGFHIQKLAGGKAWQRFTHAIFYLDDPHKCEDSAVLNNGETSLAPVNRILTVEKCRNGKASGWRLGYRWDPDTFQFSEQGILVAGDG